MSNQIDDKGGLYLIAIGIAILFAGCLLYGCNSSHRTQDRESVIKHKDSVGTYEESELITVDSTTATEDNTVHYHTGDSALDSEMEIVMQQQKDYANGDTGTHFPPRPVYTPVVIERQGNKVTVDAGGRDIQSIHMKDSKQGSQTDSFSLQTLLKVELKKVDSARKADSTKLVQEIKEESEAKEVEKQKSAWLTYLAIGLGLAFIIAVVLFIKKPSVVQQIVAKLPEPHGIKKES